MPDRPIPDLSPPSAEPVLRVDRLCKQYGRIPIIRDLQLTVSRGSVHGLVGLNGAGKTTTLECILGLQPRDGGDVSVLGQPPQLIHRLRGRVVAIFDQPSLNPHLSVDQTLRHAALLGGAGQERLEEMKTLLGIARFGGFRIKHLSLGNKRRTSIAQGLIGNPKLVLLDEPFNGLDAGGVDDMLQLIARLNREAGTSFLLSSHQLPYLEQVCTHIAILHQGRIAVSGSKAGLLQNSDNRLQIRLADSGQRAQLDELIAAHTCLQQRGPEDSEYVTLDTSEMESAEVNRLLVNRGIAVAEMIRQRTSLDTLFRQVTGGERP